MKTHHLSILSIILLCMCLLACGTTALFLVEDINVEIKDDLCYWCLNKAIAEVYSEEPELTANERFLLRGVDTKNFLYWKTLSGPKPVVNQRGLPSESKSLFPSGGKKEISDRYVLCLLQNGYQWPNTK